MNYWRITPDLLVPAGFELATSLVYGCPAVGSNFLALSKFDTLLAFNVLDQSGWPASPNLCPT
jgi:hypothetical protein